MSELECRAMGGALAHVLVDSISRAYVCVCVC